MIEFVRSFLSSYRHYNENIKIVLIPFDDNITETRKVAESFNCEVLDSGWEPWVDIGESIFGKTNYRKNARASNYFRKLSILSYQSEYFFYLDVNSIFLSSIEPILKSFEASDLDLVFHNFSLPNRNFRDDAVRDFLNRINPTVRQGFNAGCMIGKQGILNVKACHDLAGPKDRMLEVIGPAPEQSFVSYAAAVFGLSCGRVVDLSNDYPTRISADQTIIRRANGYFLGPDEKEPGKKMYFLKFRGPKIDPDHKNSGLLRELMMGENIDPDS